VGASDQKIYPVEVDLRQIDHFLSLAQTFARVKDDILKSGNGIEWSDVAKQRLSPSDKRISALVDDADLYAAQARATESFDLIVSYRIVTNQIELYCDYNGRRLRKEKVMQLMQGYAKLTRWFASQYSSDRKVSAARDGGTV
jgi:hypothetical protein